MAKVAKKLSFASEAAMCNEFIRLVDKEKWTVFAETYAWDILLVRRDGLQVGIQAKLKLNTKVITQTLIESHYQTTAPRPDYIAVLVPEARGYEYRAICAYIGITILMLRVRHGYRNKGYESWFDFEPALPDHTNRWRDDHWHQQLPFERCPLPEYVPDVQAGSSSPVQLTQWKIGAMKLAIILKKRGWLTKSDFKAMGIDHRRWTTFGAGWLVPGAMGYTAGQWFPEFGKQHPQVYEQIEADADKWMPKLIL